MKLRSKRVLAGTMALAMALSSAFAPADSIIGQLSPMSGITASAAAAESGWTTDEYGLMEYQMKDDGKTAAVRGYVDGKWTYSNYYTDERYYQYIVGSDEVDVVSCAPNFVANGEAIDLVYTVKNNSEESASYSFNIWADTYVDEDDHSVNSLNSTNNVITMTSKTGVVFFAVTSISSGGQFKTANYRSSYTYPEDKRDPADYVTPDNIGDSAFFGYWPKNTLAAGETKEYHMIVGMADASELEKILHDLNHTHEFAEEWTVTDDGHYHACTADGCDVTDFTTHTDDGFAYTAHSGGTATCQAKAVCTTCETAYGDFDTAVHSFDTDKWSKDATGHWHAATCGHDVKNGFATHVSSGAATEEKAETCTVCGYEIAPKLQHTHTFATEYSKDATGHWYAATCGHDVKDSFAAHVSSGPATEEKAETCTICGYEIAPKLQHTHTFATEYSKDATGHWYAATCGHDVKDGFAAHVSSGAATEEKAEICTICGYEIAPKLNHVHHYTGYTDASGHWNVCACGDKVFVSGHYYGNGYRCSCGYVDEARRKAIEEAQMFSMMSASVAQTASVTCYSPEGKAIASCFSRANADYVNIKVNAQYAGYAIVIKNGKTVVDTGILDKNGRYTFKGAVTGVAYKGLITKIAKPMIISTKATENSVTIKWTAVEGAEKYKVYKYVDGKLKAVGTTAKTSAKVGKLDSETEYGFAVKAYVDGKWTSVKMADVVYATTK